MTATADVDGAWTVNAARDNRWPRLQVSQPWQHRELILFFADRDVKVRYKQAFLGAAWAALNPFIGALTFTILFNRLAKIDDEDRRRSSRSRWPASSHGTTSPPRCRAGLPACSPTATC